MSKQVKQMGVPKYSKHELFVTWRMMNYRCYSTKHGSYHRYGGRGIETCQEWRWDNPYGFFNFLADLPSRPDNHTLDRELVDGWYSKGNCRWVDKRTQQNNLSTDRDTESGYTGVTRNPSGKWVAKVYLNGKNLSSEPFENLDAAIAAREAMVALKMGVGDTDALTTIKAATVVTPKGRRQYGRKTSTLYGVSWDKSREKWRASLTRESKQVALGRFETEDLAYAAVLLFLEKEREDALCVGF